MDTITAAPTPERTQTIIAAMQEVAATPPESRRQALRDTEAQLNSLARIGLLDGAQVAAAVREMTQDVDRPDASNAPAPPSPLAGESLPRTACAASRAGGGEGEATNSCVENSWRAHIANAESLRAQSFAPIHYI